VNDLTRIEIERAWHSTGQNNGGGDDCIINFRLVNIRNNRNVVSTDDGQGLANGNRFDLIACPFENIDRDECLALLKALCQKNIYHSLPPFVC
jgi:hypothetical protein